MRRRVHSLTTLRYVIVKISRGEKCHQTEQTNEIITESRLGHRPAAKELHNYSNAMSSQEHNNWGFWEGEATKERIHPHRFHYPVVIQLVSSVFTPDAKLYCFLTVARGCDQLAQRCYAAVPDQ